MNRKKLMIGILSDAVIISSLANSLSGMVGYTDLEMHYSGYWNAVLLLDLPGMEDPEKEKILDPVLEMLNMIFYASVDTNCFKVKSKRTVPERLAEEILEKWETYLKQTSFY